MTRLTHNDIQFTRFDAAKKEGDKPSIFFSIENLEAVTQFFNTAENQTLLNNKRLEYAINGKTLIISRGVGRHTLPTPANISLATSVIENIYVAPLTDAMDIYIGLTKQKIPNELYSYFASEEIASEENQGRFSFSK